MTAVEIPSGTHHRTSWAEQVAAVLPCGVVLGAALEDTFGGHLTIGPGWPAVEGGFYYDMYLGTLWKELAANSGDQRLSDTNFAEIEKSVAQLRKSRAAELGGADGPQRLVTINDELFSCAGPNAVNSGEEALELFANNPFKVDLIQRKVAPGTMTTAYRCGDLVDLCRGPHLPSTARVKAFKVDDVGG
eukprot:Skav208844  [mRNA]  locus=scaffold1193:254243:259151:+ [translate_table: standard]